MNEYWIQTRIKIISNFSSFLAKMDLRLNLEDEVVNLKYILIKTAIKFFSDKLAQRFKHLNYVIKCGFLEIKGDTNEIVNIRDIPIMQNCEMFKFDSKIFFEIEFVCIEEYIYYILKNEKQYDILNSLSGTRKLLWEMMFDSDFITFTNNRNELKEIRRTARSYINSSDNCYAIDACYNNGSFSEDNEVYIINLGYHSPCTSHHRRRKEAHVIQTKGDNPTKKTY
jgi:hypothetical protein